MTDGTPPNAEAPAPTVEAAAPVSIEAAFGSAPAPVEPAAEAVQHPSEIPTLLEEIGKKPEGEAAKPADAAPALDAAKPVEEKPADAKPPEAAKPAEAAPEEAKPAEAPPPEPEAPIEYKFEMPSVIKDSPKEMGEFTETLGGIRAPVEVGQKLLDMHAQAMTTYAEQLQRKQMSDFNAVRREWKTSVMADPVLGGSGHETAMAAAATARDRLISDAKPGTPEYEADAKRVDDFLRITGAGDHPEFLKMLYRAARFIREPSAPTTMAVPTKTNGQAPTRSLYKAPTPAR